MDITLLYLSMLLMLIVLLASLIPFIPGPFILWAIGFVVGVMDNFQRVTPWAIVFMTLFMLLGMTSEFWLKGIGMQSKGASCWASLGSIVGGFIGTGFVPIFGTMIGAIAGALLVEFMRLGDHKAALKAGRNAMEMIVVGIAVEFSLSTAIVATYVISILSTR